MTAGVSLHYAIYICRFPILFKEKNGKIQHFQRQNISSAPDHKIYSSVYVRASACGYGMNLQLCTRFSDCCIFWTPFHESIHRAIIICNRFDFISNRFVAFFPRYVSIKTNHTISVSNQNLEKNFEVVFFSW